MPRTRNITRQQWEAAASPTVDPGAATIRPLSSSLHRRGSSTSTFAHPTDHWSTLSVGSSKENYEYDDENNYAGGDENEPPVVQGKGKGKERELVEVVKRKKRPLQDITDIIVSKGNQPGDNPKRRKRVRRIHYQPLAPLQLSPIIGRTPAHNPRFPSSLPPSSPPPPTSFEQPTRDSRTRGGVWEPIFSQEQEDLPIASDDAEPLNNSDPFGFLAVERELKSKRHTQPLLGEGSETREAGGLVLVPATSPLRLDLSVIAYADEGDGEEEMISLCATPPTPHKKKRRRVSIIDERKEEENLPPSPRTESLPSSPSPLKVRESWVKEYTIQDRSDFIRSTTEPLEDPPEVPIEAQEKEQNGDSDEGHETVTEVSHRVLRSRAKGKKPEDSTPVPQKKAKRREEGSRTSSDPIELAKKLVERLPKRRRKRKAKRQEDSDGEHKPSQDTQRRRARPKKVKAEKPAENKKEISKERQAMRDYFKELEGYSLEEEKARHPTWSKSINIIVIAIKAVPRFWALSSSFYLDAVDLCTVMSSFPHQPHVQRGFEPEQEGYIAPREQSPYLAALFRFTSAINARDFDTVIDVFDQKLVYSILPTSLQRPILGCDLHLNYMDEITEMFLELRVNVLEIIEENHKLMVQLNTTGQGRSERRYENEIVLIIHFEKVSSRDFRKFGPNGRNWPDEALPKMVNVKEFVDSLRTKAWFKEERQWMKDNPQKVAEQRRRRIGEWKKERWRRRQSQGHSQGPTVGVLGQPTQYAQGLSPTSAYPPAFPPPLSSRTLSSSRSQGQGQGYSPTSSRGYGPTSTSLGSQAQGNTYTRSSQGYPASYNPYSNDKYSGM